MKKLFIFIGVTGCALASCKKNSYAPANLNLLQHQWMVISENGEALRYVGTPADYYNFQTDNMVYRSLGNYKDTAYYVLQPDGTTLVMYPVANGVRLPTGTNFTIKSLTDTQLIITLSTVNVSAIDSLKR